MAPAKKTPAKPSRSASGASKSASRSGGTRPAAPRKTATKPARRKKKRSDGFRAALFTAFAAGLLMALVCFWGIQHILGAKQSARTAQTTTSQPTAQRAAPETVLPRINATRQTANREEPQAANRAEGDIALSENETRAVAGALAELQESLPYEEPLAPSLEERIRQIDYALMQAAWQQGLPASRTRLASVEDRVAGLEEYRQQTIDILPGKASDAYITAVRDNLKTWAGDASLRKLEGNEWAISLDGTRTHLLRLFPDKESQLADDQVVHPQSSPSLIRPSGQEPRLVIVIDDLGANMGAVKRLLALDYTVTCAFWPHAAHAEEGARAAHRAGKEILIHQPMEPIGYPKVAPGPGVLLTGMSQAEITQRVESAIGRVPYAVGLNNHMGSRFTRSQAGVDGVIAVLKKHNLFMLDSLTDPRSVFADEGRRLGITTYRRNVFLDVTATRAAILEELRKAERIALLTGQSIAIGHPLPETLAALEEWQRTRNKTVKIVRLQDL